MKLNSPVTFFRRITQGSDILWQKIFIPKAIVTSVLSANSNISVKGFVPNSHITVRFSPITEYSPAPGDRLYIGGTDASHPPSSCLTVLTVSGGERGSRSIRFTKAVCG